MGHALGRQYTVDSHSNAGVTTWRYDAPDPFVAPFTTANTTEWRVGLGLEVPIWHKLIFASLVQYRDATCNVAGVFVSRSVGQCRPVGEILRGI
jgi:hypothetical protein